MMGTDIRHRRPGVWSAAREWMRDYDRLPEDVKTLMVQAFEIGYQIGYDKGREPRVHCDLEGAIDELLSSDIQGLSHAAVDFSLNEDGSFRRNDHITLYVVNGWSEDGVKVAERICDAYGCACKVDE